MSLTRLNYSIGSQDISITFDLTWAPVGVAPPGPALVPTAEPEADLTSRAGKHTERSIAAMSRYQEARGVFCNDVSPFRTCPDPIDRKVKARLGIAG